METTISKSAVLKTATCMGLSTCYFAMLAYPFGVTGNGYVVERALIAGAIFFAVSIPAWIINVRREFFSEALTTEAEPARRVDNIGQLAVLNKWLSPNDVKQILYCQEYDGMSFDKVAVKRNFLTVEQISTLFKMQKERATQRV